MKSYRLTKYTCFYTYLAMASVFALPPMLFVTFHDMYGISYTLLGALNTANFCTQLVIDLIFTFFSKHFNIKKTVRIMPLITCAGLTLFAFAPKLFPNNIFLGLVVGTVIFSVAAGLNEVLLSPLIASLPSDNSERDMSLLHSLYGWGVVTVVLISSLYFKLFGTEKWFYLVLFWAFLPVISSILYFISPIPDMQLNNNDVKEHKTNRRMGIFLCAVCIFLGSYAENTMTAWISSFTEIALLIPKAVGDILGMALFALLLAATRSIYAKHGNNIIKTLFIGMCGAVICYTVAGLSGNVIISFIACIVTGICTSMLWPGTLIMLEEYVPSPGIAAYALMAACGDLGASVGPQITGAIVDNYPRFTFIKDLFISYSPDQAGLKFGMLCTAVIPVIGAVWILIIKKRFRSK